MYFLESPCLGFTGHLESIVCGLFPNSENYQSLFFEYFSCPPFLSSSSRVSFAHVLDFLVLSPRLCSFLRRLFFVSCSDWIIAAIYPQVVRVFLFSSSSCCRAQQVRVLIWRLCFSVLQVPFCHSSCVSPLADPSLSIHLKCVCPQFSGHFYTNCFEGFV